MNIEELKQLELGYHDKITMIAWIPTIIEDIHKATFITINQPDKRSKKYNIAVRLYKCKNIQLIDIDDITSIKKGWD